MYLDLHCHSISSDDSRATVEQYLKWVTSLRKRGHHLDGLVLTEHRKFDREADYSTLSQQYDILVLKGSELDTAQGHFLVFGVNERLLAEVDFGNIRMDGMELVRVAHDTGAIAVPAHPGRVGIGLVNFLNDGVDMSRVRVVEGLNGSARSGENERAEELVRAFGLATTGGSDAHFVSAIGICLTEFFEPVRRQEELVAQLHAGSFRPVRLQATLQEGTG